MEYERYAIFYAPPEGEPLARFGAGWLGWDAARGCEDAPPDPPEGWEPATRTPRRYGFHGTLKPPFRLAKDTDEAGLRAALHAFAGETESSTCAPLMLTQIAGFFALTPARPCPALADLAGRAVAEFDRFRAPMAQEERARRLAAGLSARQVALMDAWGYPYVMDEFHFHLTLTGAVPADAAPRIEAALRERTAPLTQAPFAIRDLCLFGEGEDGRFRIIERAPLVAGAGEGPR